MCIRDSATVESVGGGQSLGGSGEVTQGTAATTISEDAVSYTHLTSIVLVTAFSETFVKMTNGKISSRTWAILFTVFSFAVSNIGLSAIIEYSCLLYTSRCV